MANIRSAIKRARQSERHRVRNRMVLSATRTSVKKARASIDEGDASASAEAVRLAIQALDRAAQKGIIHRNNAARRKSRLAKRLNALEQS